MDQISRLFAEISADNSKFKRTMNQTNSILGDTAGRFQNFTNGIVQGFGQAFGQATIKGIQETFGALSGSITGAAATEQKVADIQSILQATNDEAATIKQLLNDLAVNPNLKVSLADAGNLTEMLARNGVNAKAIIDGMAKSTILLSNATKGDYAQSADILTDVMALWKDLGLTAEQAVDSITSVTNKSKLNLNEYQYAITNVAGAASNLKIPFQDVNAALIATASYFKSGRVQGTSFNAFLTRLVPTTESAKEAFDTLGLRVNGVNQLFDETGTLKGFDQIAGMLQKSLAGLSDESAIELLSAAFGTTATDFLLGISKVGTEGLQAIKKEAANVSAEANAAVVTNTTLSRWETFKDTLVGIGNQIGDKFLPDLKRLVEGLLNLTNLNKRDFVGAFDGLQQSFKRFVDFLLGNQNSIAKGFQAFIAGITSAVNNIPLLINWVLSAKSTLESFAGAISTAIAPAISAIKKAFENMPTFNFKALFDTISSTGLLSDSSLNQLSNLGRTIIQYITAGFNLAWENVLKPAWNAFVSWLQSSETHQKALNALSSSWGFFQEWASHVWEFVQPKLNELWRNLTSWVTDSSKRQQLLSAITGMWTSFKTWSAELWGNSISPEFSKMWRNLTSWVTDSSKRQVLLDKLNSVWTGFQEWSAQIWGKVYPYLRDFYNEVIDWIDLNANGLATKVSGWLTQITTFASSIFSEFNRIFPDLRRITEENSRIIVESVGHMLSKLGELMDYPKLQGPQAISDWGNMFLAFYNIVGSTLSAVTKALDVLISSISLLQDAMQATASGNFGAFGQIKAEFDDLMSSIQGTPIETIAQWVDPLFWLGLRPDSIQQEGITSSSMNGPSVNQGQITVKFEGDGRSLTRDQISEIARLLQQQMNIQGVRVTP